MKYGVTLLLLLTISLSLAAEAPFICTVEAFPHQLQLSWSAVDGAHSYDLYVDGVLNQRTVNTHATIGSNTAPLFSHRHYAVMVLARGNNNTLVDSVSISAHTLGWEGEYYWKNETKKDNRGRVKELHFRVTYDGGDYRVEAYYDRWYTLYPMVSPNQIGVFFTFSGGREIEQAYRANALTFSTSLIRPDRWKVTRMAREAAYLVVDTESRAGGIPAVTRTDFSFIFNEQGKRELHFATTGEGIASMWVFRSPNPGDNGVFKAVSR